MTVEWKLFVVRFKPWPPVRQGSVVAARAAEAVLLEDAVAPGHRALQRP